MNHELLNSNLINTYWENVVPMLNEVALIAYGLKEKCQYEKTEIVSCKKAPW